MKMLPPCALLSCALLLAGCATLDAERELAACRAESGELQARYAALAAERQKTVRAAERREEALRRQLEGLKAIEREILDREDRIRTPTR